MPARHVQSGYSPAAARRDGHRVLGVVLVDVVAAVADSMTRTPAQTIRRTTRQQAKAVPPTLPALLEARALQAGITEMAALTVYGGIKSLAPYTGALAEAAHNLAALICPPVNAPAPHETSVLRWPCESCILWAKAKLGHLVAEHRALFPRFGVASDAQNVSQSIKKKVTKRAKPGRRAGPRQVRATRRKPSR